MEFPDVNIHIKAYQNWITKNLNLLSVRRHWHCHLGSCQATLTPIWRSGETPRSPVTHATGAWLPLNAVSVCLQESQLCLRLLDSGILHLWVRMSDRVRERLSCCSNLIGHWDYFIFPLMRSVFRPWKSADSRLGGTTLLFLLNDRLSDEWAVKYLIKCANMRSTYSRHACARTKHLLDEPKNIPKIINWGELLGKDALSDWHAVRGKRTFIWIFISKEIKPLYIFYWIKIMKYCVYLLCL